MPSHYKRKYRSKKKGAYALAKKALKISRGLKRQVEYKHVTYDISSGGISWIGTYTQNVNATIQDQNDTSRIGDKIFCNTIRLNFKVVKGAVDANFRIIAFWDKQNTLFVPNDLIQQSGTVLAPLGDYNTDNRNEWILLFDKRFNLTDVGQSVRTSYNKIRLHKQTTYDNGTSSINTGRLALFYISDVPSGSPVADFPIVDGYSRMFYSDL